jgi:hypothetical protein
MSIWAVFSIILETTADVQDAKISDNKKGRWNNFHLPFDLP